MMCRGEAFAPRFIYEPQISYANASPFQGCAQSRSLGAILQNFKSVSGRKINRINSTSGETIWQRNYHDRIIRDEKSLHDIRHYITENPHARTQDPENPQKLTHPSQKAVDSTSPKAEFIF
jgi:hypothetical protein